MKFNSLLEELVLGPGEDLPPMPHFERIEADDPPMGMYGTYPAAFVPYDVNDPEDEPWNDEPIEVAWLQAMWVYYMQQISRGMGFELSQGGVLLGVRLMHEDHHRNNVRSAEDYFFQFLDTP